jgi:hypothetical protein
MLVLVMAGLLAAAAPSALEMARDQQDRATLEKLINEYSAEASKAPTDAAAQYKVALACSYLAEVAIEQHDKKAARPARGGGILSCASHALRPGGDRSYERPEIWA